MALARFNLHHRNRASCSRGWEFYLATTRATTRACEEASDGSWRRGDKVCIPYSAKMPGTLIVSPTSPLISMLSHMHNTSTMPPNVEFLYSTKAPLARKNNIHPQHILFLPRLTAITAERPGQFELTLFVTGDEYKKIKDPQALGWFHTRRIEEADLIHALGAERDETVVYICGPPGLTDELVEWFGKQEGMSSDRVFCEKWW